jgi:hypothetical protein
MSRAIISAAGPTMSDVLDCSQPTFERFAEVHGYELDVRRDIEDHPDYFHPLARAARWGKIALIEEMLDKHELVLWMDADAMFTQFDRDLADDFPADCFQALTVEQSSTPYRRGFNPNTGVWAMRQDQDSRDFIAHVMQIGQLDAIGGTDQEAVCTTLGWEIRKDDGYDIKPVNYSPFLKRTGWLPFEWNPLGVAAKWPSRVLHFAGLQNEDRIERMQVELEKLRDNGSL